MPLCQRAFDDLGTPLHDVTFCIVDLETTGGSSASCAITEIGAVKVRGGELLGTFATLVNPGVPIPPSITILTGITQAMLLPAPRIAEVLPAFLEFAEGSVLVAHNARFDISFLNAALAAHDRPRLDQPVVDTCALARRLVGDEVPNCRLDTLASQLRLSHRPTHRALDDALATTDLLHVLLERAGGLGVTGLDDLLDLPTIRGHPQLSKLRLTDSLPRAPGVYLFRDRNQRVLYVGKATDLRSRVRSYFSGDERRKIAQLLRETAAIDHVRTLTTLEAAVLEVRLIHRHLPRFNRQSRTWGRYAYVKLTLQERWPRLSVVRAVRDDGALYLGPLAGRGAARKVVEAIESVAPLRRCTARPPRTPRPAPCTPAQLGTATCPCAGTVSPEHYAEIVDRVAQGLSGRPQLLLGPLEERMTALAASERFEEAADVRDRVGALAAALRRRDRLDALRRAGRVVLVTAGARLELQAGLLSGGGAAALLAPEHHDPGPPTPLPAPLADEVACVAAWVEREAHRVSVLSCSGELASRLPALPRFDPRQPASLRAAATKVRQREAAGGGQ